jgi:hypothetical protein
MLPLDRLGNMLEKERGGLDIVGSIEAVGRGDVVLDVILGEKVGNGDRLGENVMGAALELSSQRTMSMHVP